MNVLKDEVTFPVPWGKISGRAWGISSGIPLLAIHGILDNSHSFDQLLPLLPNTFYCVCIDLPGHGLSTHFPKGKQLHFVDYLHSIKRVVDYLQWEHFYIIGHSLGAQLGSIFAAVYPERVLKLVLIDGLTPFITRVDESALHIRKTYDLFENLEEKHKARQPPSYSYEEAFDKIQNGRKSKITKKAAESLIKRALIPNGEGYRFSSDERLRLHLRPLISGSQMRSIICSIKCDTLVFLASSSVKLISTEIGPQLEERVSFFRGLKETKIVVVEGNHNVHMNKPESLSNEIIKFLTGLKSSL